jgi:hypothetical protein
LTPTTTSEENAWVQIIIAIVSLIISILTAPKPKNAKPISLSEDDFPQTVEGSPIVWVFGDVWIQDWMVLGVGNFRLSAIKTKSGK